MKQLATQLELEPLCCTCQDQPIHIKKRGLCSRCYQRWWERTHRRTRKRTPKEILRSNLVENHGKEILKDFDLLFKKQFWNLTELAKAYGFTRERARQLFKGLYGIPYGQIQKEKTALKQAEMKIWDCVCDPRLKIIDKRDSLVKRGAKAEVLVLEKCEELGYECEYAPKGHVVDFKINGKLVEVKSRNSGSPTRPKGATFYCTTLSPRQQKEADFVIFYVQPQNTFYVFPNTNGRKSFVVRDSGYTHKYEWLNKYRRNMYWERVRKYEEAWHLLK